MEQPIKRQDFLTLHYIVEQAHKKYLKQSRINKQPTFNILRILSSFKQIFPTTPDRLYKLIMLITKKHNPQTLDQWTKAIDKINSPEITKNSHSLINLNESSIREPQSRILKQKHNDQSIKTYKEELDHQIECIESKRSRMKFIGDFRVTEPSWMAEQALDENKENNMSYSNKNSLRNSQHAHLISFQPTHKDSIKENAQKIRSMIKQPHNLSQTQKFQLPKKLQLQKKINPYHEITKIDNLSLIQDRQPTSKDESKTMYSRNTRTQSNSRMYFHSKTPRDNSIIRAMALDSKDSDVSMRKSELIAGKSGEILECQYYNMSLQQWEELNDRAIIFQEFNTKLKAFSALLANYQAFESDRYLKNKADIFHSCYLETKAFIGLKSNLHFQQIYKEKLNKAEEIHRKNLTKKVWKVLQVLKDLRIQGPKKPFEIEKLNRINYEFMLSFMFQEKSLSQSSPRKYYSEDNSNQSLDFDRKVQYFSKTHNFQNVWNIYKYFGLNISMSKDQLAQFFRNYHQCLQKTIFGLLKKNVENNKYKYLQMHDNRLIEKTFSILLGRRQVAKEYKQNELRAERYANRKLKQKAYKILLSIVYSTKIFSKRQEFIEAQKAQRTKLKVMQKWISEYKAIQLKKKALTQKLDIFVESITKFITTIAFKSIKKDSVETQERIVFSKKHWQQKTLKKVLKHFSTLIENKKKYINLCQTNQIEFQKKILAKWLRAAQVSNGLKKISKNFNKIVFRKLFVPLAKIVVKEYLMNQEDQKNLVKECFDALKTNFQSNQSHRNQSIEATAKFLKQNYISEFIQSLKLNKLQSIKEKESKQLKTKSQLLVKSLQQSTCQQVYIKFKEQRQKSVLDHSKLVKLKSLTLNQSFSLLMKNTLQDMNLKSNSQKLTQYLKLKCFQSLCKELKRNQLQKRAIELKLKSQKRLWNRFTIIISQRYLNMKKMEQKAHDHFRKVTEKKGLYSLAQNFIQITEKSHNLEKMLEKSRMRDYWGKFVMKTRKQVEVREKSLILLKMQPFSCLRENKKLKRRQKEIKDNLKQSRIHQGLNSLLVNRQIQNQKKQISYNEQTLKYSIFWMRFNDHFISGLMDKKHTFMAYKFRALKLYATTFNSWRQILPKKRSYRNQLSQPLNNEHKRQKSINIKTKELTHMYKPTDCE